MVLFFDATWQKFSITGAYKRIIISGLPGGGILLFHGAYYLQYLISVHAIITKSYVQLFIAHLVFALAVLATQKAADRVFE